MANIDYSGLKRDVAHAGTWGNKSSEHRKVNSKPNIGDVLRFMVLPAGTKVLDFHEVYGAFGTGVTASLGYLPVDGSAGNATAFKGATSIATAGDKRMSVSPVVLDKDSYIVATIGGANAATAQDYDLNIDYEFQGK